MHLSDPAYYLQIVDRDHKPVLGPMRPLKGRHGAVDLPLVETCVDEVIKRLGLFADAGHSEPFIELCMGEIKKRRWVFWRRQAIHDGIMAAMRDLPMTNTPIASAVRDGVTAAIQRLKDDATLLV